MLDEREDEEALGSIVGAVVQMKAACNASVRKQLEAYEDVEIHTEDEQSRLVITMEAATSKAVLKLTEAIQNLDGVMSVTPVYQYSEDNKKEEQPGGWRWR